MTTTRTPLPAADDKARAVEDMFDRIAPRYDVLNRVLTFGLDIGWRKATVRALRQRAGAAVLDVACGTGDLCRELERVGYTPVGIDFSEGMLGAARTDAALVRGDALRLPFAHAAVDGLTSGFALRNFTALEPFLAECARVIRPGGRLALLDVAEPRNGVLRTLHGVYFRKVVPAIGGLVSDRSAYRYLPASTAYLPPPDELVELVAKAGFAAVTRRLLGLGAAQLLVGTRT